MFEWKFADPQNVAVIADREIVEGGQWIAHVFHDAEDGAWQFHTASSKRNSESQPMVVSLRAIVQLDPSIVELADLPLGWHAWRDARNSTWQRESANSK